jgi:hypothetical protein
VRMLVGGILAAALLGMAAPQVAHAESAQSVRAAAASAAPAKLTLASSRSSVRIGMSTILSGSGTAANGNRVANAVVELWTRPIGNPTWLHVQNTKSNPLGHYTFSYLPDQASAIQARRPGSTSVSPVATVSVHLGFDSFYAQGCAGASNANGNVIMIGKAPKQAAGTVVTAQVRAQAPVGKPAAPWTWPFSAWSKSSYPGRVAADGSFEIRITTGTIPIEVRAILKGKTNVIGANGPIWGGAAPFAEPPFTQCEAFRPATAN